ncbi:MAG TPA: hypothetical protein VE777_05860 [Gaiellales bacterium]|jgi:hypothetical protein|nr:hypothetical protein [Gaiellales bacterium]
MSEDETRAAQEAAAEYMRQVGVADVVVSTAQTLIELGYRRTGLVAGAQDERDLPQSEIAIEAVRALMPVLEQILDPASMTSLRGALSQVQLAYARASETPAEERPPAREEEPRVEPVRPKIWTPGGEV